MDVTPARFFDGRHASGQVVAVTVKDGCVLIQPQGCEITWPLRVVTMRLTPDGAASVSRGRDPARLLVADPTLLAALRAGVRRSPRRQSGWRMAAAAAAGLFAAAALLVVGAPSLLAPIVPPAWEAPLGRMAQASLLGRHRQCTGVAGQRALDQLVARLSAAGGIAAPVQLTVADDALVNAFSLPGNRIVLLHGLIAAASDGDELAGVLAHELGHIAHRDAMRQLLRRFGLSAVATAFGWGSFDSGGVATALLGLSYGRAAETQADAFAIATLRRAGLRGDGLGRFFSQTPQHDSPGFLSDHPPTADREAEVRQAPDGAAALGPAEWQAIRTMCQP